MRPPNRVRIMAHDFSVVEHSSAAQGVSGALGYCDTDLLEIAIATDIPRTRIAEVFLHEILHAIWFSIGLEATKEDDGAIKEERVITGLARGFQAFMRDNPEAMRWYQTLLV